MSTPVNTCTMNSSSNSRINILALSIALCLSGIGGPSQVDAFVAPFNSNSRQLPLPSCALHRSLQLHLSAASDSEDDAEPVSGSFFNAVPPPTDESSSSPDNQSANDADDDSTAIEMESSSKNEFGGADLDMFEQIIQKTTLSRSSGGKGFSKTIPTTDHAAPSVIQTTTGSSKKESFVGIGKPLNDINNPEYDENGYTLYADETTGEKKRVFEALVEYPTIFKMKIVGKDEPVGSFASEMVDVIAKSCGVERSMVKHSERKNGKWTSVTVHAPVKSADMLYALYQDVDKDPRVKFKF